MTKLFLTILSLFISVCIYAQTERDSTIFDLNGKVYKTLRLADGFVMETYYHDLDGIIKKIKTYRELHVSIFKERDPVFEQLYDQLKFPRKLESETHTFKVTISFIVERDGMITNLRFINKSQHDFTPHDIISKELTVNPIDPVKIRGEPIEFEMIKELVLSCTCAGQRDKEIIND